MKRIVGLAIAIGFAGCGQGESPSRAPVDPQKTPDPRTERFELGGLRVRTPARASDALHVERAGAPGVFVDVRAIGARDVVAVPSAGRVVFPDAFDDTEVVHVLEKNRVEELRHVARRGVDRSLHYRVELGPALQRLRAVNGWVEALDRNGVARLRAETAYLVDARGEKRTLEPSVTPSDGAFLLDYAIDDRALEFPITIDPAWTLTTFLAKERYDNALYVLASGKAISIAGLASDGPTATTEIYDPATSSWTAGPSLLVARHSFASAMLSTGEIFVVGGYGAAGTGKKAELFDPVAGTWTARASAPTLINAFPVAIALPGKKVLAVGPSDAHVYDVVANAWTTPAGALGRVSPAAAAFGTGKVLVAGGEDGGGTYYSSAQIYDASSATWTSAADMKSTRSQPSMAPLSGGKLLVAGGWTAWSTAEIYDPATNTWTLTPAMTHKHSYAGSVVMPGGKVLLAAGDEATGVTDTTDLFDPVTATWTYAGSLALARDAFSLAVLPSGKVLVAGGANGGPTNSVEIFDAMKVGNACAGPGECVSGFCVEGVCCAKSACASDETCAGTGSAGTCAKKNGQACTGDGTCASGHCADGLCCDTACTDLCGACDLAASKGKCVPAVAGDAPHGTRGACPGAGICIGKCGGVDPTKCTQFPGTAITCAKATCKDGSESRTAGCDGAGACAKPATTPCDPYVCGATACKTECAADADCTTGNQCDLVGGKCVVVSSCSDDHTVKSPEGTTKDCTPFRCVGSRCAEECTTSDVCATGYLCDTASRRCLLSNAAADHGSSGGCAFGSAELSARGGARDGWGWFGGLLALFAVGLFRRR